MFGLCGGQGACLRNESARMTLLIDENLSPRLPLALQDIFPGSLHVFDVDLDATDDDVIWSYALENRFAVVTKDRDYYQLSLDRGHPPKVLLILTGNTLAADVVALIRSSESEIRRFLLDGETALLSLG